MASFFFSKPFIAVVSFFAFYLSAATSCAQLEGTYELAIKKQEQKKQSRWTLTEWMEMKDRNRWMDLWLAQNSHSSLYEFFLEAQAVSFDHHESSRPDDKLHRNVFRGSLAAYAGIVGLRGAYESTDRENLSSWEGSFNLRLFGRALQDTHINLGYGLKGITDTSEQFQNQFASVSLNLYLLRTFGLEGTYKKILPASNENGRTLQGEGSQAGIFIDFGLLRVFGSWRKDFFQYDGGSRGLPNSNNFREGLGGGLRFYF